MTLVCVRLDGADMGMCLTVVVRLLFPFVTFSFFLFPWLVIVKIWWDLFLFLALELGSNSISSLWFSAFFRIVSHQTHI